MYPQAYITTTGHSLGESLAMYVALKENYRNVGFNGPDIHNLITDEEINWMQSHPEQFRNYRNLNDSIGNITGNKTKTAIYVESPYSKMDPLKNHDLDLWNFGEDGRIIDFKENILTSAAVSDVDAVKQTLVSFKQLKKQKSKGGYSRSEKIVLDSAQALMIAKGMANAAADGAEDVKKMSENAVSEAKELWNKIDWYSFQALSYDEVVNEYAANGITEDAIVVGDIERFFSEQTQDMEQQSQVFEELSQQIQSGVQQVVDTDIRLAGEIKPWKNYIESKLTKNTSTNKES